MKRFATLIVALAMVLSMTPALQMIKAADPIRDNLSNKPATMVFNKWYRVGYDRDGNMLNPNTIIPADITRQNAGGLTYRFFPWQKEGQEVWGRPSVNNAYELPRIVPTLGHLNLGRLTPGNRDFNYADTVEQYAWWTEFFLTVTPNAGDSQQTAHWYAVIDKSGNLWLDPDGIFHNCGPDQTADPMNYQQNGQSLYVEGSCINNPKGFIDPIPANNTQGPYALNPNDANVTNNKIYFWWKFDNVGNSVDRLFKVGWADMVDYDPIPNHFYPWNATNVPNPRVGFYKTTFTTDNNGRCPPIPAGGDDTLANNISRVSYIPTYDPYLNVCLPQHDIDWDFKLNTRMFIPTAPTTVWPNVTEGSEVFWDANGNDRYDPYEYIYRKGQFNNARFLQANDIRTMNTAVSFGTERGQYRFLTNVQLVDLDYLQMQQLNLTTTGQNMMLKPLNPILRNAPTPANFPYYVHTDGGRPGNPNDTFEFDEFVYEKAVQNANWGSTTLTAATAIGATQITVASTTGLAIGDTIIIYGNAPNQAEIRTIINILPGNIIVLSGPALANAHFVGQLVVERGYVELNDIRLTNVNRKRNNLDDSLTWSGMWWNDALVLLEVLNGGCATPKYNITVQSDLWEGMNPAVTAAALRSPSGDIIAAAQHIQKTTVLDPTGLEFRVPSTTFENVKLEYREYIGVEVFKDNGINNNLGDVRFGTNQNSIQSSMSDDYNLWQNSEEFVGCVDEELAKDYRYANFNMPFFGDDLYMDISNDGYLGTGEPIYRDMDVSRTITTGDIRLTPVTLNNGTSIISYPAGSRVTAGDKDIGYNTPLMRPIPTDSVRYADLVHGCEAPNQQYDVGEPIYYNPGQDPARQTNVYSNNYVSTGFAPFYNPADFLYIDETNANVTTNPPNSMQDTGNLYASPNETLLTHTASGGVLPMPVAMAASMRLQRGEVLLSNPRASDRNVTFNTTVGWNNAGTGTYGASGVIFRYANDMNFTVVYLMPGGPTGNQWRWRYPATITTSPPQSGWNVSGPGMVIEVVQYRNGQGFLLASNSNSIMSHDANLGAIVNVRIANSITMVTVTSQSSGQVWQSILSENDIFGPIGFTKFSDHGTYLTNTNYFFFDDVTLLSGASMDIIRLTDVYAGDAFYPSGSRVGPGDFYRLKNPLYGISMGRNCSRRYADVDVLPGDVGLKVEVDKPLKVEQTSHIKITVDPPPAGEYLVGKVVGDSRTRLFYKPDSFFVRMIPKQYQVIYSSPSEAKANFFKPDKSINGEVVYVSLRNVDVNEAPLGNSAGIRDIWDKTGILDAKHPTIEWEFTPYRGTILDQVGQDMPVRIFAFMDRGGPANDTTATFDVEFAPRDSRFTFALNQFNSATRTVDPNNSLYRRDNYVDPFYMNAAWTNKEAYANYFNQAYTRAARIVYSPYQLQTFADCELDDAYDCFGQAKLHVEPEGIELIPSSPCVDPLSYRYPNATLTLKAYDNPSDVNDPAGYLMTSTSPPADSRHPYAIYNVNGAGIKCMFMARTWSRNTDVIPLTYYIIQLNDDGSYHFWRMTENAATVPGFPQVAGVLDPNDVLTPDWWIPQYNTVDPFNVPNYIARGTNSLDVGDADCSVGTGTVDLCGTGFPPLGDYTPFDTYGQFWDPPPNALGEIYCYGVQTLISYATTTDSGGTIALCFQPINSNSKVNIRVHTTNILVDYNSVTTKNPQDGNPWSYFITDRAVQYNWGSGAGLPDFRTNPPGIRRVTLADTVDYCDVVSLKVLPPDPDLNFNNMYMVDHALQYSNLRYTVPGASMLSPDELGANRPMQDPKKWIQPPYNPLCVYRPLSSDKNTDVRAYPGGQTHLGRVFGSAKGAGFNAYPSMWPRLYNKLGTEFHGLTDYGLYFQLSQAPSPGNFGKGITFTAPAINGGPIVKRIEVTGPFMTPYDYEPDLRRMAFRAGTGTGSLLGYSYKGLRYVPIRYNYSGKIVVDSVNYTQYQAGGSNITNVTQLLATNIGDRIYGITNPLLFVGKELDYSRVWRFNNHIFIFDELIMNGPGRIEITVWLNNGIKKIYQDCCVEPPATGIDVSGIKIENMPGKITVDEPTVLELKLTEGYGVENPGPPVEYGKKIQEYRECNDAFAYVWQDRGVLDPIDKLYRGAGDGYCTMMPIAKQYNSNETGMAYEEEDDLNSDGKISFDKFETEIMGMYDMASSTWVGGIIDARTFQRQDGKYSFPLDGAALPTTVGIDFGQRGVLTDPDHVIGEDEMLDITVTAYKYGDDDNSRSFRPFLGDRFGLDPQTNSRRFSHEVYLAGQVAASVEAKPDLTADIKPALLTSGITPELVDPTQPLSFILRDANQKPIDLSRGVPDPRGGDEVKKENAWMHLFKDPHPDDDYYFPGQYLPQYYWLRTDLHNDDYTPICNRRLYSYPRYPFQPIKFNWVPVDGEYKFLGFVANDKGEFDVHIYTPDRKHKAVPKVQVELPRVTYDLNSAKNYGERMSGFIPSTGENPKEDFICTAADYRWYQCNVTMKTAEGKLIQGLAETTSVCMGGQGQNARFTPFFTRPTHFDWVTPPATTFGSSRRSPTSVFVSTTWLAGTRADSHMHIIVDSNNNGQNGDVPRDYLHYGSQWTDLGIRLGGSGGMFATYYPTVNMRYDDGTYSPYQCWDGPFDKPSAGPQGFGIGSIYNNEYEKEYIFADGNRDFTFNYKDSLLINNRGQGTMFVFTDDAGKFGVTVGVTDHAMVPAWSDIQGGTDPYNEYSPQRMQTRFVHITSGNQDLGTNDGAYALDWDSMPNHSVEIKYPTMKIKWAETMEEVDKAMLNTNNYDIAYGIQNHLVSELLPADPRDLPLHTAEQTLSNIIVGTPDALHPWGGNRSEDWVRASVTASPINARTRIAQYYVTPTGTGEDTMNIDLFGGVDNWYWPVSRTFGLLQFDVIMSLQVVVETTEQLKVGRSVPMTVTVLETSGKPVGNAKVHIKGAGVEMEKQTDKLGANLGKITFNVSPTERGRITVTATAENMKGAYTTVFVDPYIAPPTLDVDPVQAIVGTDSVTITGRTNEGSRILVNGKPVTVAADGKFTSTQKLQPGANTIVINATNNSGQVVSKVIRIESRTQPSGIIIDPLGTFENVSVVRVRGHVEPGSKVTVTSDASGKQVEAIVTNDVFVADVDVKAGNNTITVDAIDIVGKKSTPKTVTVYVFTRIEVGLQLGSQVMYRNGVPSRLGVAPQLVKGTTMVPFRAIAEAFGAKADFDQATRTIKVTWDNNTLEMVIGKTEALKNGQPVKLTAAPMIVGGSTLVPFRFVEIFGNVEVGYNAATKVITAVRRY